MVRLCDRKHAEMLWNNIDNGISAQEESTDVEGTR